MPMSSVLLGAAVAAVTGVPLLALYYVGERIFSLPFPPFTLFDWIARILPGSVVTFGIDSIVSAIRFLNLGETGETAKVVEQSIAVLSIMLLAAVIGGLVALVRARSARPDWQLGFLGGGILSAIVLVAQVGLETATLGLGSFLWITAVTIAWGIATAIFIGRLEAPEDEATGDSHDPNRRAAILQLLGGSLGLALGAWGLGQLAGESGTGSSVASGAGEPLATTTGTPAQRATESPTPSGANATETPRPTRLERIEPAPGTRPEVTSLDEFYRIDINTRPPVIDREDWQLEVAGLFRDLRSLTLDDLMNYASVTQPITLSCISNRIAGDLISTGYWTGVRLRDVVNDLGLLPEAGAIYLEAEDGFYETVVMDDIMDERTLLVYGMNDRTLPVEHGYPLRIYIPNRYGMKQPKWIVRMEAIEAWAPGYWVERGWSREARPHIVSVIDTVANDEIENGLVPIGGIAWAGDRGIQRVEVQVDDGDWNEAELRKPPLSTLTWVQWRYDWPAVSGRHRFTVRATDGTGMLQIAEETGVRPDGATGYHSITRSIR